MNKEEIKKQAREIALGYSAFNEKALEQFVDDHDSLEVGETVFTDGDARIVISENGGVDRVENGQVVAHQDVPMEYCIAAKAAIHARNSVS